MMEIMGLIILLVVSVVVFSGWLFLKKYCLTATEYLSKHPKLDFIIHVFTGLGSGWLIALWMPKNLALALGVVLVVAVVVICYVIPTTRLPMRRSSGMRGGLPFGVSIAWLSYPCIPEILTLILGAISIITGETAHYVFPNLVVKKMSH